MNEFDRIARADRAKALLDNELLAEARQHIEAQLWAKFQEVAPDDTEALQHIKAMQYFHGKYFQFLAAAVQDGKLASLEVERKKKTLREKVFGSR